jgi:hypothetical protein
VRREALGTSLPTPQGPRPGSRPPEVSSGDQTTRGSTGRPHDTHDSVDETGLFDLDGGTALQTPTGAEVPAGPEGALSAERSVARRARPPCRRIGQCAVAACAGRAIHRLRRDHAGARAQDLLQRRRRGAKVGRRVVERLVFRRAPGTVLIGGRPCGGRTVEEGSAFPSGRPTDPFGPVVLSRQVGERRLGDRPNELHGQRPGGRRGETGPERLPGRNRCRDGAWSERGRGGRARGRGEPRCGRSMGDGYGVKVACYRRPGSRLPLGDRSGNGPPFRVLPGQGEESDSDESKGAGRRDRGRRDQVEGQEDRVADRRAPDGDEEPEHQGFAKS